MEKSKPIISVLMGVYNNEDTVEFAIKSIITQTYDNIQFVIVDDGSNKKTKRILKKYGKKDNRIEVHTLKENKGLARALNYGLKFCKGEYIARQDADDWSNIERLSLQLDYMNEEGLDFVGCNVTIGKRSIRTASVVGDELLRGNMFAHGTILFKKKIIQQVGNYNPYFRNSQDYELFLRIYKAGYKMGNMPNFLYHMDDSNCVSNKRMYKQALYRTFAKLINIDDISGLELVSDLGTYLLFRLKEMVLGE